MIIDDSLSCKAKPKNIPELAAFVKPNRNPMFRKQKRNQNVNEPANLKNKVDRHKSRARNFISHCIYQKTTDGHSDLWSARD